MQQKEKFTIKKKKKEKKILIKVVNEGNSKGCFAKLFWRKQNPDDVI